MDILARHEPNTLIFDNKFVLDTASIVVAGNTGALKRGAIIATVDGADATLWNGNAGQTATGILCDDIDATGNDSVVAQIYRSGHFVRQTVSETTGTTITTEAEKQLRDGGIFLSNQML